MKSLLFSILFTTIATTTLFCQETEERANAVETLVKSATGLLGPIGTLVDLAIEDFGTKRKELNKKIDKLKNQSNEVKSKYNSHISEFENFKSTFEETSTDYKDEINALNNLFKSTTKLRSKATIIDAIFNPNTINVIKSTGDQSVKWWFAYHLRFYVNELYEDLKNLNYRSNPDIAKLDKAILLGDISDIFSTLESYKQTLENDKFIGPNFVSYSEMTSDQKTEMNQFLNRIDNAYDSGNLHPLKKLTNEIENINTLLYSYLTTYMKALEKVESKLAGISLDKLK